MNQRQLSLGESAFVTLKLASQCGSLASNNCSTAEEGLDALRLDAEQGAEWIKSSAVSVDEARRSMDRLDSLERSKPTIKQVGRYGTIGGLGGAGIGAVGNLIETGAALKGATPKDKALNLASSAVKGALSGGALPLLRAHSDRHAEMGTLRKFMQQDKVAALGAAPLWRAQAGFTPPGMQTAAQRLKKSMSMGTVDPSKGLKPLNIKVGHTLVQIAKLAGLGDIVRQGATTLSKVPTMAKNVALGAGERNMHLNEVAGLGVLAVPGLDTMQSRIRARLAGDRSAHGAEKRQLLGEGTHAALDVGGLGLLAAPAAAALRKHAFANSGYAGNVAQNGPGMKSHSQLPAFRVPELQVKVSGPLKRIGELVTGSKAGRLREAALRHADRAVDGKLPRELKAAKKLRGLAKSEENRVGNVQGALVGSAALGAVSDTSGLAEKVKSRKKEAGILQRAGELVTGSRLNKLRAGAKDLSERAAGRAAISSEAGGIAHALGTVPALIRHPKGKAMFEHASKHSLAFGESAQRHGKAALKAERLVNKEDAKVFATRAGAGIGAAAGGASAVLQHRKNKIRSKEAGVGVGAGMTTSQYSGPLSYGPFKQTSGIPPFRRPAMTKNDESLDAADWMVGVNKESSAAATGAMTPAGKLTSSQRIGAPKTTGFSGPSIADIAKPKGFGTPMPGAQKNTL